MINRKTLADRLMEKSYIFPTYLWLLTFLAIPLLLVLKISFSSANLGVPPYLPSFDWTQSVGEWLDKAKTFTSSSYEFIIFDDPLYLNAYLSSLRIALTSTFFTLLVGYPIAYGMARAPKSIQPALVMMIILPFWTSFLIRVYALIGILKPEGYLSGMLMWLGLIDEPLQIFNTEISVIIGIVYSYLPFLVLPLFANLEKMDVRLLEAAQDLGCPPLKAFWAITFPLSIPGIVAGCFLVFIPAVGEFVIPDLLGGSTTLMIGKVLWTDFFGNRDWPVASAVAVVLLLVLIIPITIFQHMQLKSQEAR